MTFVSRDQEIRSSTFGAFQEAIVCGFTRDGQLAMRRNDLTLAPNQSQRRAHLARSQAKLWPPQHNLILSEDRIRNRKPKPSRERKVENGALLSLIV
jgi:hypothetical protein